LSRRVKQKIFKNFSIEQIYPPMSIGGISFLKLNNISKSKNVKRKFLDIKKNPAETGFN